MRRRAPCVRSASPAGRTGDLAVEMPWKSRPAKGCGVEGGAGFGTKRAGATRCRRTKLRGLVIRTRRWRGWQGRETPGPILARRDGGWEIPSFHLSCPMSRQRFSFLGSRIEPRKRGPKVGRIRLKSAFYGFGAPSRSQSSSFDQRRRPEMLRTAIATAFFWPTMTTSRLPRVTPV
jgi:hypothetical protein